MSESKSLREKSLEWFFVKTDAEKKSLRDKYFEYEYIEYDHHWGYHFTFGQIEQMYKSEMAK